MDDSLDQLDFDPIDLPILTPKASLTSLPVEIKARIAELARLQDERFKERSPAGASGKDMTEAVTTEWHGRSLSALAQTCHDFNKLASMHLFRTLSGVQIETTYFQIRILPRHAHAVRTARLDDSPVDNPGLLRALATLHHLPHLHELHLDSTTYLRLFRIGEEDTDLAREVVRQIAPRITSLILRNVTPAHAINILTLFSTSNLYTVRLGLFWHQTGGVIALHSLLTALPQLRALAIESSTTTPRFTIPPEWSQGAWVAPIRSLTLVNAYLDDAAFTFVNLFSESLEHLEIKAPSAQAHLPPPLPDHPLLPSSFPRLSSLVLFNVPGGAYQLIVKSLAPTGDAATSLTPLRSIHAALVALGELEGRVALAQFKAFDSLQDLHFVGPQARPATKIARALAKVCARQNINLSTASREDPHRVRASVEKVRSPVDAPAYAERIAVRHRALARTLEFGLRKVNRMLAHEDLEEMEMAFKVLRDLHGWELLEED